MPETATPTSQALFVAGIGQELGHRWRTADENAAGLERCRERPQACFWRPQVLQEMKKNRGVVVSCQRRASTVINIEPDVVRISPLCETIRIGRDVNSVPIAL
jgi:hypothetical protein